MWKPRLTKITSGKVCSPCWRVLYVIGWVDWFPGERRQANRLSRETTTISFMELNDAWYGALFLRKPLISFLFFCLKHNPRTLKRLSRKVQKDLTYAHTREASRGVLPYITYRGMCRPMGSWFWSSWFRTGYPFQRRFLERGIIFRTHESFSFVSSHLKLFTDRSVLKIRFNTLTSKLLYSCRTLCFRVQGRRIFYF